MNRGRLLSIATIAVVVGIALFFILGGDQKHQPSVTCTQDAECASDRVCCQSLCKPQDECVLPEKNPKAPDRPKTIGDRKEIEALLTGVGGKLQASPRVRPDKALPKGTCQEKTDCPGLQTCDPDNKMCQEPPICLSDEDCGQGKLCNYGECVARIEGCRIQDCIPSGTCNFKYQVCEKYVCQTDNDCAGPRRCDPHTRNCVECIEDGDCAGASKCQPGRFCMGDGGCAGDGDCEEGLCDRSKATCHTSKCQDDDFEENDKWSSATLMEEGGDFELKACPDDNDWFKLELNQGEGFVAQFKFNPLPGMIEAVLSDVNGLEVRRAGDANTMGSITMAWPRVERDSIYYLGVKQRFGIDVPYRMKLAVWPDGFCQNDEYEPNNDFKVATAVAPGTHWSMKLCEGDDDWIIRSLENGQKMDLLVEVIEGDPVRVEVFRDEEDKPFLVDDSRDGKKVLHYSGDRKADYYIRVSQLYHRAETLYHVKIDLRD